MHSFSQKHTQSVHDETTYGRPRFASRLKYLGAEQFQDGILPVGFFHSGVNGDGALGGKTFEWEFKPR
jgi:hypothetical protein